MLLNCTFLVKINDFRTFLVFVEFKKTALITFHVLMLFTIYFLHSFLTFLHIRIHTDFKNTKQTSVSSESYIQELETTCISIFKTNLRFFARVTYFIFAKSGLLFTGALSLKRINVKKT